MSFQRLFILNIALFLVLASFISSAGATGTNDEFYIAKGIENINAGKYPEALELFNKALEISPANTEALFYSGVACSRMGKYNDAEKLFLMVLENDENNENALLELGRIQHLTLRCDKAKETLSRFIALTMEDEAEKYALNLIQNCGAKEKKELPYKLSILAGSQYDTNVITESANPVVSAGEKADTSVIFYLSAGVKVIKNSKLSSDVGYVFYQSLHSNLNNLDIQYHKLNPKIEFALSETIKPTIGYSFEYTFVGGNLYSRTHNSYGTLLIKESEYCSTEAVYEHKYRMYSNSADWTTNAERTASLNTIGIKQFFDWGKLSGNIYYLGDFNKARQAYYSYDGYRSGAELDYNLSPFFLNVAGEFGEATYKENMPGAQVKRIDSLQEYTAGVTYVVNKKLGIILKNTYTKNNSNINDYTYTRNVTGIFLWGGIL